MGRPVYQYELSDPDFSWLIDSFRENHPEYNLSESTSLPMVFIQGKEDQIPTEGYMPVSEEAEFDYDADNG